MEGTDSSIYYPYIGMYENIYARFWKKKLHKNCDLLVFS